jgi:hypothetical protein
MNCGSGVERCGDADFLSVRRWDEAREEGCCCCTMMRLEMGGCCSGWMTGGVLWGERRMWKLGVWELGGQRGRSGLKVKRIFNSVECCVGGLRYQFGESIDRPSLGGGRKLQSLCLLMKRQSLVEQLSGSGLLSWLLREGDCAGLDKS